MNSAAPDKTSNAPTSNETLDHPASASCSEILDCIGKCAQGDQACESSCVAQGSADAKAGIDAITRCFEDSACVDAQCATQSCGKEINACKASTAKTSGKGAKPSAGSVPASLVGTWSSGGGGASIVFTFNADGTYRESSGLGSSGACASTTVWDANGIVSFGESTVTFERLGGTMTTESCSQPKTDKPLAPEAKTKAWTLEGNLLYMWGSDCADYETCAVEFEKQ